MQHKCSIHKQHAFAHLFQLFKSFSCTLQCELGTYGHHTMWKLFCEVEAHLYSLEASFFLKGTFF